jgi:excisionase family DNA binding protein
MRALKHAELVSPRERISSSSLKKGGDVSLPNLQPHFVSIPEAAQLLGCGRTKLYEYIRDGRLHTARHGTRSVVSCAELAKFSREMALEAGVSAEAFSAEPDLDVPEDAS